jgi:hypothetical protein
VLKEINIIKRKRVSVREEMLGEENKKKDQEIKQVKEENNKKDEEIKKNKRRKSKGKTRRGECKFKRGKFESDKTAC